MTLQRLLAAFPFFTPADGRFVEPDSCLLEATTDGVNWFTIPGPLGLAQSAEYQLDRAGGRIWQLLLAAGTSTHPDWSLYLAYRISCTVFDQGLEKSYVEQPLAFLPEVDANGQPIFYNPIGESGQVDGAGLQNLVVETIYALNGLLRKCYFGKNSRAFVDDHGIHITLADGTEVARFGNLNGFLGYVTDEYGWAIGNATTFIAADNVNELRIQAGGANALRLDTNGLSLREGTVWTPPNSIDPLAVNFLDSLGAVIGQLRGYYSVADDGHFLDTSLQWGASLHRARIGWWVIDDLGAPLTHLLLSVTGTTHQLQTDAVINSTVSIGTAPITPTSTTMCPNLNADMVDGLHATDFLNKDGSVTATGDLPLGSHKVTGLANGALATDAANCGQAKSQLGGRLSLTSMAAGATVYTPPLGAPVTAGGEATNASARLPLGAGVLRNLRVDLGAAAIPTNAQIVVTVMLNNVATALAVTLAAGTAVGVHTDNTHAVTVAENDLVSVRWQNTGSAPATTCILHGCSLDFGPI